jgi:hypothetical protein
LNHLTVPFCIVGLLVSSHLRFRLGLQSLQSAPQLGSWFVDPYRSPRTVRNGRTAKILLRETENSKNTAEAWPALFTLPRVSVMRRVPESRTNRSAALFRNV